MAMTRFSRVDDARTGEGYITRLMPSNDDDPAYDLIITNGKKTFTAQCRSIARRACDGCHAGAWQPHQNSASQTTENCFSRQTTSTGLNKGAITSVHPACLDHVVAAFSRRPESKDADSGPSRPTYAVEIRPGKRTGTQEMVGAVLQSNDLGGSRWHHSHSALHGAPREHALMDMPLTCAPPNFFPSHHLAAGVPALV